MTMVARRFGIIVTKTPKVVRHSGGQATGLLTGCSDHLNQGREGRKEDRHEEGR